MKNYAPITDRKDLVTKEYVDDSISGAVHDTIKREDPDEFEPVGSEIKPVYVDLSGYVRECDHTLESDVPSDAEFTDTRNTVGTRIRPNGTLQLVGAPDEEGNLQIVGVPNGVVGQYDFYESYGIEDAKIAEQWTSLTGEDGGIVTLTLGNSTANTSDGAKGRVSLYNSGTTRQDIIPNDNSTANNTIILPATGGTLALLSDIPTVTDTKNTAGATNTTSALYLVGSKSINDYSQTYLHSSLKTIYENLSGSIPVTGLAIGDTQREGIIRLYSGLANRYSEIRAARDSTTNTAYTLPSYGGTFVIQDNTTSATSKATWIKNRDKNDFVRGNDPDPALTGGIGGIFDVEDKEGRSLAQFRSRLMSDGSAQAVMITFQNAKDNPKTASIEVTYPKTGTAYAKCPNPDSGTHQKIATTDWVTNWVDARKVAKNMIQYSYASISGYANNGVTFTYDETGVITANGTATGGNAYFNIWARGNGKLPDIQAGKTYTLTLTVENGEKVYGHFVPYKNGVEVSGKRYTTSVASNSRVSMTFVGWDSAIYDASGLSVMLSNGTTYNNTKISVMIEEGDQTACHSIYPGNIITANQLIIPTPTVPEAQDLNELGTNKRISVYMLPSKNAGLVNKPATLPYNVASIMLCYKYDSARVKQIIYSFSPTTKTYQRSSTNTGVFGDWYCVEDKIAKIEQAIIALGGTL